MSMSMSQPVEIALYSDIACPYAYITVYRLRKLRDEYRGRVQIRHKSLALEYVNKEPTNKPLLDSELPPLMLVEPDIPYQPWHRPSRHWPLTMWPAFEAVKCAERQSPVLADDLTWAIRVAFFNDSRCISLRHVLLEIAEPVGLDMARFIDDFDSGVAKRLVIEEARDGWEREGTRVPGSPTLVLPSGEQFANPALPEVDLDEERAYRAVSMTPAPCMGDACLDVYRRIFDKALAG